MTWGEKNKGNEYAVKGIKGKKAMDQHYSTNLTATGIKFQRCTK